MAFLAGLITSPHCVLMCGPLAFVLLSPQKNDEIPSINHSELIANHLIYHAFRILSFSIFGGLAGFMGLGILSILRFPGTKLLPWALACFLLLFAFKLDKLIPKLPFAKRFFSRITEKLTQLPKKFAASMLGLATPMLPCGPLYMMLWVALSSGNPFFGAQLLLAFGLGTIPLMLLTSTQYYRLSPKIIYKTQRILAFIVALFIIYRTLMANSPLSADFCCPWN